MATSARRTLGLKALVVDDELTEESAAGRAVRGLVTELKGRDIDVVTAMTADDAIAIIRSDPALQCILLDWDLGPDGHDLSASVVEAVRQRNTHVPVFLMADRSVASSVPASIMAKVNDFIWMLEDTVDFVGGRVEAAILRYRGTVLPPMFSALTQFAQVHEYSWHTPGHTGFLVASGNDQLLIWGDIVHVPELQTARPEVCMAFDVDAAQAEATRRRVFDMVTTDKMLVTGMHLHFPGYTRLVKCGNGYQLVWAAFEHAI